jgi:hypothetical protein
MADDTGMLRFIRPNAEGRMVWTSKEGAREFFYHDCDDATVDILCEQDRAKPHWMSVQVCERLGVVPLKINASHSPFLSKPGELANLLVQATNIEPVGPLRPS